MVQFWPGSAGMVLNSGVCFALVGIALLLPLFRPRWTLAVQTAVGCLLMGLALTVLIESIADRNFGIDFPSLHAWLGDDNPRPGRMAFNSCIGFAFCGLALFFMRRVRNRMHGMAVQVATIVVLAGGLIGVVGYSLDLGLLYPGFHSPRMALHTAGGMILAGIGLWVSWFPANWYRSRRFFKEDEKLSFAGGAMLIVVALTAGIAAFSAQESTLEKTMSDKLASLLNRRITLFQNVVHYSLLDTKAVAARTDLLGVMQKLRADPDDPEALRQLQAIGKGILLASNINGIAIHDAQHREVMEFGDFSEKSEVAVDLQQEVPSTLFWNGTLYLNSRLDIVDREETLGFLVVEQSLPILAYQLAQTEGVGETGKMSMCVAKPDHFLCFPQSGLHAYSLARHGAAMRPMNEAASGKSGIFKGSDDQGRNIIAAYAPVDGSGLAMVVNQDTEELYLPIRKQLESTVPLLFLFVVASAWLLRFHIKPLAARLLQSERDATEKELRTRTVVDNVGDGIITINADGVIESFNNAASRIFGYSQEEAIGQNIRLVIPDDMHERHDEGMQNYLRGASQHIIGERNVELSGLHKNGMVFPLELTVNEVRVGGQRLFVGIIRDITRRKKMQEALRAAHAELEKRVQERTAELLNANQMLNQEIAERKRAEETLRYTQDILTTAQAIAHLGSWRMDIKTGEMEWSDELFRICGLKPQCEKPSLGLGLSLLHGDDRRTAQRALTDIVAGKPGCKCEWRIVAADGSVRYVQSQAEGIRNEQGEVISLVGTFLDITEHKLAEEALRQSQDQLRKIAAHQDRIKEDERKRIAREIHDELGSLLTGIKSYLSFFVDSAERYGVTPDRHIVDARDLADNAIDTARRVITDLRPSVLDQLGLWAALEWYADQFEERTGLACGLTIDAETAAIKVDPERSTAVFRIVQEALTNVARHAKASRVAIQAICENGHVAIKLVDDGRGIEPQSFLNRESWGIVGMYERARYFGGELNITGAAGQGTVVDLRMPMESMDER